MSRKLSRSDALEDISNWSTNDVLNLLRKNGLEECCHAVAKRQIDGDELLHLTEGKLSLWKSDLTRPLIWSFWTFVEEVRKAPEKYVEERPAEPRASEDHLSDTGSWGTEFDDEITEEQECPAEPRRIETSGLGMSQRERESRRIERESQARQEEEETYANFEAIQDEENTYANFEDAQPIPPKNVSRLHTQLEKSLAEQLKEQLKLRNAKKPVVGPKPEVLAPKRSGSTTTDRDPPQKSFLHTGPKPKARPPTEAQKRMSVPPPPEPKKPKEPFLGLERHEKELPKPPLMIRNLDLVANLPMRGEDSEDEYESFDEHIIEQNQKKIMSRVNSRQSLASGHHSSAESIYKPSSVASHDDDEQCEIYESITEAPEDSGYYLSPIQRSSAKAPPPLPAKPPQASSIAAVKPALKRPEKHRERSPDKKSATLPHSGSSSSLSTERATRPLPPPPDRLSYVDKPWFHNVTRDQAIDLINDQNIYGEPQDGYFLLRPSTKHVNNPLTLVLWYKDRVYNIAVRKKPDNRYALGSAKVDELSFSSVEEIVNFHMRQGIVLYTNGVETGSTRLTNTPPK